MVRGHVGMADGSHKPRGPDPTRFTQLVGSYMKPLDARKRNRAQRTKTTDNTARLTNSDLSRSYEHNSSCDAQLIRYDTRPE
eukprot:6873282-Prymnesium_polylepis.1